MTAIPATTSPIGSRAGLTDIWLKAAIVGVAFAAFGFIIRLSGTELLLSLLGCLTATLLLMAARRSGLSAGPGTRLSLPFFSLALGAWAAALGAEGGLLFLPCLFFLGAISTASSRSRLFVCSLLAAGGFVAPLIVGGAFVWVGPAAAGLLVAMPLGFERLFRGVGESGPTSREASVPSPRFQLEMLTPRQAEVTALQAEGMRHREIAERLGVSVSQVRRLNAQARERAGAKTTAELIALAIASSSLSEAE